MEEKVFVDSLTGMLGIFSIPSEVDISETARPPFQRNSVILIRSPTDYGDLYIGSAGLNAVFGTAFRSKHGNHQSNLFFKFSLDSQFHLKRH